MREDNYYYFAFGDGGYQTPHRTMKAARRWIKSHTQWGAGTIKDRRTGRVTVVAGRKRKNPVRTAAQVTGSGTGWIKAKAVKVRKVGKGYVVDVKR